MLIGALIWLAASVPSLGADPEVIAVIVSPGAVVDDVSSAQLKDLYFGRVVSLGGVARAPVTYPAGTPLRVAFEKKVLGVDPSEITKHWKSQAFLGFAESQPVIFSSPEAVKRYVARQAGAVGYIPLSQCDATVHLVAKVEGKAIGSKAAVSGDYPFTIP